jgi:two-component system, chemotaxis family, protein-glutamate methylesterase/glutaminase
LVDHDIIVIGASAGGIEALKEIVGNLPSDLAAAIFITLHIPAYATSILPAILSRAGPLGAVQAADGDLIQKGVIHVAPPDHHLFINSGYLSLFHGPKENRHRPAVDPMFRSAAIAYGPRVIGVVLTGNLDDGTAGMKAIKARGGIAVIQDPKDALYPGMPRSVLQNIEIDYSVPLTGIAPLLVRLVSETAEDSSNFPVPENLTIENKIITMETNSMGEVDKLGSPSAFTCPECHGTLWEIRDEDLIRFRCQTGHAYSADSLDSEQTDYLEASLWVAVRVLEEKVALSQKLAARARERNFDLSAVQFEERAQNMEQHVEVLRKILLSERIRE